MDALTAFVEAAGLLGGIVRLLELFAKALQEWIEEQGEQND
jgi:hypothetical protein